MRVTYWTIRVVPDALRIAEFGVGVIAHDPESGVVECRMAAKEDRVWSHIPNRASVRSWLSGLCGRLEALGVSSQLELDHRSTVTEHLSRLQRQMHNVIRIDAASYAAGDSVAEVADLMFTLRISDGAPERSQQGVPAVRRSVLQEYRSREHLREALFVRPQMVLGGRMSRLDAAVVGEDVVEINRAFSFAVPPSSEVLDRADAWTYRVQQLRRSGGTLVSAQGERWSLAEDTPVLTVIEGPETVQQRELFDNTTRDWESLRIRVVDVRHISAHADQLESQLSETA